MTEIDKDKLIAEAYLAACKVLPNGSKEDIQAQTILLANQGMGAIQSFRSKGNSNGSPSVGVPMDNTTPKRTEDEILEIIDKMTPEERRTARHIRKMWDANEDPLYDGYRILQRKGK
ncbi:MAG: hypothetical protein PVF58_14265 [Candidatus Methanofastidiosia archaeon]|jgi:hypothetical protein